MQVSAPGPSSCLEQTYHVHRSHHFALLAANIVIECCFHGPALHPDTGKIAGYKEQLTCSTAHLWDTFNGLEIEQLFQSLGANSSMPTGTTSAKNCFFIHKHDMHPLTQTSHLDLAIFILCLPITLKKLLHNESAGVLGWLGQHLHGHVSTKMADLLTTTKCLFNNSIS